MRDRFDEPECENCGWHENHSDSFRDVGDHLVTIIGFWPVEEYEHKAFDDRRISRCHYRTVCNAAHWDLQLIGDPAMARIPGGVPVIGVDEPYTIDPRSDRGDDIKVTAKPVTSIIELEDFEHPKSATYILGNTHYQRPSDHFECDQLIGITMDDLEAASYSPFYGNQMAALIWYDRRLKSV